jgi:hypothetical protein
MRSPSLRARISRPANHARFFAASASFFARMRVSSSTTASTEDRYRSGMQRLIEDFADFCCTGPSRGERLLAFRTSGRRYLLNSR